MRHLLAFSASTSAELSKMLTDWGAEAPARLDRRGQEQQKRLERWCLNRFLKALNFAGECDFPVGVYERENPDFDVFFGSRRVGLEVTEAVDEEEQKERTRRAKRQNAVDDVVFESIPHCWTAADRIPQLVGNAISKKATKASSECDELLIYFNSYSSLYTKVPELLQKIVEGIELNQRFTRIWVLSEKGLLELVQNRVVSKRSDF